MNLLIIGGSDAGISAALRAREMDATAEITVVLADWFPNYSICGLPFYLSGETTDWRSLAHRTEFPGIQILPNHIAKLVNPSEKNVVVRYERVTKLMPYDRLVLATGAIPVEPKITGLNTPGVHLLHTMADGFRIHEHITKHSPKSAIIIGAGYIGLEMADALTQRGLKVILASRPQAVLPTVEKPFGLLVQQELERHGVGVWPGTEIVSIKQDGAALSVQSKSGEARTADLVLVATGVTPSSGLADSAGIRTGPRHAIRVNERMETDIADIFAAGDCVETWHRVLNSFTYLPLGTTSHKQGRVAGENAVGGNRTFKGSVGTQVVKVFELAIARTGLLPSEAKGAHFDPFTIETVASDHKAYYPGARELHMRITGDDRTGRLLGAQLLGHWKSEVSKRIDTFAAALFHEMKIEDLNDLDLSYTPPLSSPWDPIQIGAQVWSRCQREQIPEGDCLCQNSQF
jgi:NADPH-dependent 2,4-dienoyl-CoA reductase/sulfur reductase-like enzyme